MKKFILTRFTGHKKTMSNGMRWRFFTESSQGSPGCWICDKWVYTLFIWTRSFGVNDRPKLRSAAIMEFEEKKRILDHYDPSEASRECMLNAGNVPNPNQQPIPDEVQWDAPILTGSFNEYEEPQEMMRIKDFTAFVDKRKEEYMA